LIIGSTAPRSALAALAAAVRSAREPRYTEERRESPGTFEMAKPRPAGLPVDFEKAMDFDADLT
jgi:hypothetical protein